MRILYLKIFVVFINKREYNREVKKQTYMY